ncbi:DUF3891 family protein [Siminovitchia sediminis]|uniref:DUF3891 family protein n=1 Tax=Siminovitchia sediminis TaxID=1274353 RepID=A0ABW4KJW2_9BACI
MIVREREKDFVMIEQHHHGDVSGKLLHYWKESLWRGDKQESVFYAVHQHDCGWKSADKTPIWNDQQQAPYTFMDFPMPLKTLIYRYGIDEIARENLYAALLCSKHYTHFMEMENSEEAQDFVKKEEIRQRKWFNSLPDSDRNLFHFHFGLLKLFDNLSLFLCLNEPGKNEHPFYRNGIPLSPALHGFQQEKLDLHWMDENTLAVDEFPFEQAFTVSVEQKVVSKSDIAQKGLIESYMAAPIQEIYIQWIPFAE